MNPKNLYCPQTPRASVRLRPVWTPLDPFRPVWPQQIPRLSVHLSDLTARVLGIDRGPKQVY